MDDFDHHDNLMKFTKANSVMFFLERLVFSTADSIPDNDEAHLPLFEKKKV